MLGRHSLATALLGCAFMHLAQAETYVCARNLYATDLDAAIETASEIADRFRDAVSKMSVSKSTVFTVGSALMGSAMANEVGGVAEGLRRMTHIRNQFTGTNREIVLGQLELGMQEASARVEKVANLFARAQSMAADDEIKALAVDGQVFAASLARAWVCSR